MQAEHLALALREAGVELDQGDAEDQERLQSRSTGITPAEAPSSGPNEAAASPSKKLGSRGWSARERMAELLRDAERAKEQAQLESQRNHAVEKDGAANATATAAQVGAARAAAKIACGTFYTRDEQEDLLARMRNLSRQLEGLQQENLALKAEVANGSPSGGRKKRSSFSKDVKEPSSTSGRNRSPSPLARSLLRPPGSASAGTALPQLMDHLAPRGEPIDLTAEAYAAHALTHGEIDVQVARDRSTGGSREGSQHGSNSFLRKKRIGDGGARVLTAMATAAAVAVSNLSSSFTAAPHGSRDSTPYSSHASTDPPSIPVSWTKAATA